MAAEDHGLGVRGLAFYAAASGSTVLDAGREALVVEASRMADRLEQLNDVIAGKGVLKLMHFRVPHAMDDAGVVKVEMSVDSVMAESRQLQLAFERLSKSLGVLSDRRSSAAKGDVSDDLAARRTARIASASGS